MKFHNTGAVPVQTLNSSLLFSQPRNQNESTRIRPISALTSPGMGEVRSHKRRKLETVATVSVFQDTKSDLRSDTCRPSDV